MLVIVLVSGQNVVREKNNNDGSGAFDFTYADISTLDLFTVHLVLKIDRKKILFHYRVISDFK